MIIFYDDEFECRMNERKYMTFTLQPSIESSFKLISIETQIIRCCLKVGCSGPIGEKGFEKVNIGTSILDLVEIALGLLRQSAEARLILPHSGSRKRQNWEVKWSKSGFLSPHLHSAVLLHSVLVRGQHYTTYTSLGLPSLKNTVSKKTTNFKKIFSI